MKARDGLFALCLALLLVGRTSAADVKKLPVDGDAFGGPWGIHESKGGGNVVGPAVSDRCFRYGSGRKIARDMNDGLHVVYVDPYPSNSSDIPPSDGPYQSCTYASSFDGGLTWERKFLDDDFFSRYPAIAVHGNTLHVIYTNWESKTSYSNVEYTRSTDGGKTWLPEAINITPDLYSTGDCDYAGLDVDQDGNPHVSFIWPNNGSVYWTMSLNGGDLWEVPQEVSYGTPPNGTISFANVVINPHTNQPHIFFTGDGTAGMYGEKNFYHSFYMDGIWSYPTENVTGHPSNDAGCWGCGTLVFDADEEVYTAYLFVDDQSGGELGTYSGIGVYKRTDFSTNLGVDPRAVWGDPIVVADYSESIFESDPWYPSAAINPGSDPTSATDDTIFCVFATGEGGQDNIGDIFIRYSTDGGLTWLHDWQRNPLTADGDVNEDNWPEVDWGSWSKGHLDVAWIAAAGGGREVQYFDAYIRNYRYDAALMGIELPLLIRKGDNVQISATVGNRGTRDLLPVRVVCTVADESGEVHFEDATETEDLIQVGEEGRVTFSGLWSVNEESFYSGIYTVTCSTAYYDPGPPTVVDSFSLNDVFKAGARAFPNDDRAFCFQNFQDFTGPDTSLQELEWTVEDSLNPLWGWLLLIDGEEISAYCGSAREFGLTDQQMNEFLISKPCDCSGLDSDKILAVEYVESMRGGYWASKPMWMTTLVSTDGIEWDTVAVYGAPTYDGEIGPWIDTKREWRGFDITPLVEGKPLDSVRVGFHFVMLWGGESEGGHTDGHWLIDNFALVERDSGDYLSGIDDDRPSPPLHPEKYYLSQNYPNPFNPVTEIAYALPRVEDVTLMVYNLLGQKVRTLVDGPQGAGHHLVRWEGRDDRGNRVASGVYFYRLEAGEYSQTRRMLFLK